MSIVLYGIQFPQQQIEDWINSINHYLVWKDFDLGFGWNKGFPIGFHSIKTWPKFQLLNFFQNHKFKDISYFLHREIWGKVQPRAREIEKPPDEINSGERIFCPCYYPVCPKPQGITARVHARHRFVCPLQYQGMNNHFGGSLISSSVNCVN